MKKLKIGVLSVIVNNELALEYCGKQIEPCPYFRVGQEFIIEEFDKPKDFCPWAWQDIFYMVHTLWNGGTFCPWYKEAGIVIGSCTDGIRPVTFKIERIE